DDAVRALTDAGVPAEPVRLHHMYEFFDDPANREAGLVAGYEHAAFGHVEQPGAYWHLGDLPLRLDRASPVIGHHTLEVLADVGSGASGIDALYAAGGVGGPTAPPGVTNLRMTSADSPHRSRGSRA